MSPIYIYPGTFSPPTFGHLHIVEKALKLVEAYHEELTVICSVNPGKDRNWFSAEESKKLWSSYLKKIRKKAAAKWKEFTAKDHYPGTAPMPVKVKTLAEFINKPKYKASDLVMIRGIRGERDLEEEKKVVLYNKKHFNISNFLYICADPEYHEISSTHVRELVSQGKFVQITKMVSPEVFGALLERRYKND